MAIGDGFRWCNVAISTKGLLASEPRVWVTLAEARKRQLVFTSAVQEPTQKPVIVSFPEPFKIVVSKLRIGPIHD